MLPTVAAVLITPNRQALRELLNDREAGWVPRLRSVSLAAELDVDEAETIEAARALGDYYFHYAWDEEHPATIAQRWPACVVLAMTGVAAHGYRKGSYWSPFDEAFGGLQDQQTHEFWSDAFQVALRRLGLAPFDGLTLRNVGPVLMHAGVPTYCFDDLLRLLAERLRLDPDLDAEAFLTWVTEQPHRIGKLDKPVQRFLGQGTDFAVDFVDRCLEMLDALGTAEEGRIALPVRFAERATAMAAAGELTRRPRPAGGGGPRVQQPRILLDPWGRGVEIALPSVGDAPGGSATWTILIDGARTEVRSRSPWSGVAEPAPGVDVPISRPARTVEVGLAGTPRVAEFQLVGADAPWLLFDDGGRLLPAHAALPCESLWVLRPETETLEADRDVAVIEEGQIPGGWAGWQLERISLSGVTWLQLGGRRGSRRAVRGFTRPRIETGRPVVGIESQYGSRVFPTLPEVWLPSRAGAETEWRITVRPAGSTEVVSRRVLHATDDLLVTDLLDELPRPVLGAFTISVGGPLGYGVDRTVFVAEGLRAEFQPPVRGLTWSGLVPGTATLVTPVGGSVQQAQLSFKADETMAAVEYRTDKEIEALRIRPPHLRVSYEIAGEMPSWQPRPLLLIAEDLRDEDGVVAVGVPSGHGTPAARLVVGEEVVQEIVVTRCSADDVCRFALSQIVDTVTRHPNARLVVLRGTEAIPVATIRPRTLARGADLESSAVVLRHPAPVALLTGTVYPTRAPWREPVELTFSDGRAELPEAYADAGPLLLTLAAPISEWAVSETPRWPRRHLTIGGTGHLTDGPADEVELSRYLAGAGPIPPSVSDPAWLWTIVDLAPEIVPRHWVDQVRRECGRVLATDVARSLAALTSLGLDPPRTLVCLVASGLSAASAPPVGAAATRRLWSASPASAVLLADAMADDHLDAMLTACGENIEEVRRDGVDRLAALGIFDQSAVIMSTWTPEAIDVAWSAARVVPKGLLDADTRSLAARQLFDAVVAGLQTPRRELDRDAKRLVAAALPLIERVSPVHAAQIAARVPTPSGQVWQHLPALSAAHGALARLAARGDDRCRQLLDDARPIFVRLAENAPDMVTIDLVLAEALSS